MSNMAVIGAQWGDEGKGKIVDLLSDRFDVVARFQGGPNAGHTVVVGEMSHALHHVPSGVFRPDVRIVIGNDSRCPGQHSFEVASQVVALRESSQGDQLLFAIRLPRQHEFIEPECLAALSRLLGGKRGDQLQGAAGALQLCAIGLSQEAEGAPRIALRQFQAGIEYAQFLAPCIRHERVALREFMCETAY